MDGLSLTMALAVVALLVVTAVAVATALAGQRRASAARRQLERTVRTDGLTGLPNRMAIAETLAAARARAARNGMHAAVIAARLHRFELVNETYGPEVGDALLRAVATQLLERGRPGEVVTRDAGPTFVVVLDGIRERDALARRAAEIGGAVEVPYAIGHDHIRVTLLIGAVLDDRADRPVEDLLEDAGLALEQAAGAGSTGTTITIYDKNLRVGDTPVHAERRLRRAIDEEQFRLHYLPVVELGSGRIAAVEARLVWDDPDRGTVTDRSFVERLHTTGLLVPVAWWGLEETCRQSRDWQDRFGTIELRTIARVPPRLLAQADLADQVLQILDRTGATPDRLCLEIPEWAYGSQVEDSWSRLRPLKEAGILLGLADFGVGYSSLRYLRRFQLDLLKIDRVFVQAVGSNRADDAIVEQLVSLCHALGIAALADGVDTEHQAMLMQSMRCDYGTGELFGAPVPAGDIDELLATGTVKRRPPTPG
jgi:diguanylate cyclase (GGDEF)-like protein